MLCVSQRKMSALSNRTYKRAQVRVIVMADIQMIFLLTFAACGVSLWYTTRHYKLCSRLEKEILRLVDRKKKQLI